MLEITATNVAADCEHHCFHCQTLGGISRGCGPWHACLQLDALAARGRRGFGAIAVPTCWSCPQPRPLCRAV